MATDSREDVASKALARLGEGSISDFNADNFVAEKVNLLYEETVLDVLSRYPWKWAQSRKTLAKDAGADANPQWSAGFLMPVAKIDRVGNPTKIFNSTALRAPVVFEYEIEGKWIYTNYSTIAIEYIKRKDESLWPGYFVTFVAEVLAAQLALPITEIESKEVHHREQAWGKGASQGHGGMFAMAKQADSIGGAPTSLLDNSDPMTTSRFGGGGGRW